MKTFRSQLVEIIKHFFPGCKIRNYSKLRINSTSENKLKIKDSAYVYFFVPYKSWPKSITESISVTNDDYYAKCYVENLKKSLSKKFAVISCSECDVYSEGSGFIVEVVSKKLMK